MTALMACLMVLAAGPADRPSGIDPAGVLRWLDDGSELALFGVNYYAPHWYDYRRLGELGLDRRQVIEQDVAHLARLGIDLLRVHVFDRELSDRAGNLVANEHLDLLDHLLAECRRRGIYAVLTPIAWWATPNPAPGFSSLFSMAEMTGPVGPARQAQRNYLEQFVRHVNSETGLAFGDDPQVVALELINEPIFAPGTPSPAVTDYVNDLVDAVRDAGCQKPLFFNCWEGRADAVAASRVDGVTDGWYVTGLQHGSTIQTPVLALARNYRRFDRASLAGRPRGIYEFDAADVERPMMYPAMARAFREAGVQWAAQFQYDCWPLAASNADWDTHYLSLPYTPAKALSFAIAARTFRELARGVQTFDALAFGSTTVSEEPPGAVFASETEFLATGDTPAQPPAPVALRHLAGGSSPLVRYDGSGAWFLDQVAPGAWRLEVYPDAVPVADPHDRPHLDREATRLIWRHRRLTIRLPDLGPSFSAERLTDGASMVAVRDGALLVRPGVYRLLRKGVPRVDMDSTWFAPPPPDEPEPALYHLQPEVWVQGEPPILTVIACPAGDDETPLQPPHAFYIQDGRTVDGGQLRAVAPYTYQGRPPAVVRDADNVEYGFTWTSNGGQVAIPRAPHVDLGGDQLLFDGRSAPTAAVEVQAAADVAASTESGERSLLLTAAGFADQQAASWRFPLAPLPPWQLEDGALAIELACLDEQTDSVELALVADDGRGWGTVVPITTELRTIVVPLTRLTPLWATAERLSGTSEVQKLALTMGAWLYGPAAAQPHGLRLERVSLVRAPYFRPRVWQPGDLGALLAASAERQIGKERQGAVCNALEGGRGVAFAHPGFGPGQSTSLAATVPADGSAGHVLAASRALFWQARANLPSATRVEIVLTERDGSPWGTELELDDTARQGIAVDYDRLRFFAHWPHPPDRGGPGDRLNPAAIERITVTYGYWLNPQAGNLPWSFTIEQLRLLP